MTGRRVRRQRGHSGTRGWPGRSPSAQGLRWHLREASNHGGAEIRPRDPRRQGAGRADHETPRDLRADFWIAARDGGIWSEHQARNWREREFRPVVRQVAVDFPQFPELRSATPYLSRHTFVSCCLQAGISLATIAAWSGTSIQMISRTYGRMIRRHEGAPPLGLAEQYHTARVQAMSLLSAQPPTPTPAQGGPTDGPTAAKLPRARRRTAAH